MFLGKCLRFFPQQMRICKKALDYPHNISRISTTALLRQQNGVNVTVSKEGKQLQALWNNSTKQSTYHSVWLRHNCNCPQCLNSSNQNAVASYELDPKVTICEANVTGINTIIIPCLTENAFCCSIYKPFYSQHNILISSCSHALKHNCYSIQICYSVAT